MGAPAEAPLTHLEGKGAVEGDDERAAGGLLLQLLEEYEEQGLEPLVLIEPAIPSMLVEVLIADMEGDGPDQGGKGRRPSHRARQPDGAWIDTELQRVEAEQLLPPLQEGRWERRGLDLDKP